MEATKVADEILGVAGAMICPSKSMYRERYPENVVAFNGNVLTSTAKIWWGDIDCTRSGDKLQALANRLGERVYVLREMDARFNTESNPNYENAVAVYDPE